MDDKKEKKKGVPLTRSLENCWVETLSLSFYVSNYLQVQTHTTQTLGHNEYTLAGNKDLIYHFYLTFMQQQVEKVPTLELSLYADNS